MVGIFDGNIITILLMKDKLIDIIVAFGFATIPKNLQRRNNKNF